MNTHSPKMNEPRPSPKKQTAFAPPDLLKVSEKDPNFAYRWIKPNDRMNFYNGEDQRGWEIVRWGAKGVENNTELTGLFSQFAVATIGSVIRTGDLVLARMPKSKAKERNEYYLERARQMQRSTKKPKRDIRESEQGMFTGDAQVWTETKL